MKMVLVLQVDGPDTEAVGIFRNAQAGFEHIVAEQLSLGADSDDIDNFSDAFGDEFAGPYLEDFDKQFESGFGSFDYRFVTVEVHE